jgi:hypothetical protein
MSNELKFRFATGSDISWLAKALAADLYNGLKIIPGRNVTESEPMF